MAVVRAAATVAAPGAVAVGPEQRSPMSSLLILALATAGVYWACRYGKRLGSRLAYRIGRRHGRRFRRRRHLRKRF